MGLDVEAFVRLSASAPHGATIAGRCSVFAKSDMIHLQQKGTPVGEIAYGLCLAMARNFLATVIRGRPIEAIGQGLGIIRDRIGSRLRVLGVAVTGSGRHLAGHLLGADLVKNEITCQLRGAVEIAPDARGRNWQASFLDCID